MKFINPMVLGVLGSILAAVALSACYSPVYPEDAGKSQTRLSQEADARSTIDRLVYIQDYNTGICYAYQSSGSGQTSTEVLATVPCEPVEKFLVRH